MGKMGQPNRGLGRGGGGGGNCGKLASHQLITGRTVDTIWQIVVRNSWWVDLDDAVIR